MPSDEQLGDGDGGGVDQSEVDTGHDAVLRVFDATDRLGEKIVGWRWESGRRTMHPNEHDEARRLTADAEQRADLADLEHGTVLARIWMDGRSVETIEWDEQYVDTGSNRNE